MISMVGVNAEVEVDVNVVVVVSELTVVLSVGDGVITNDILGIECFGDNTEAQLLLLLQK